MRADVFAKADSSSVDLDDPPETDPRERTSRPRDEYGRGLRPPRRQDGTIHAEIGRDRLTRPFAERDDPFLIPFAHTACEPSPEVEVTGPQPHDFGGPAAARVERLERGPVAPPQPGLRAGRRQEPIHGRGA